VITPLTRPPTNGFGLSVAIDSVRSVVMGKATNTVLALFAEAGIVICIGSNRNPERDGVTVIAPAAGTPGNATRPLLSVTPWRVAAPDNCTVPCANGRKSRRATLTAKSLV